MAPPNLTREQAAERSAVLTVDNYRIELDLTDGAGAAGTTTFRSTTTITFDATDGASTFVDLIAQSVHSATLNGKSVDVSGYTEENGIALSGLAARNELTVEADCLYTNTGEGIPPDSTDPAADVQRDVFPSGHTQITLLVMVLAFRYRSRTRWFLLGIGSALIVATVYLRYHYVIDLLAGTLFAILTLQVASLLDSWWDRRRKQFFRLS